MKKKILLKLLLFVFFVFIKNYSFGVPNVTRKPNVTVNQNPTGKTVIPEKPKASSNKSGKSEDEANIYLNFENASLASVLDYLAEQKKLNILPHTGLNEKKVSLTTRTPLTLERAWNVLLTLLEMNEFSIIKVGNLYRVVSNKENMQHPLPTYSSTTGTEPEDLPESDLVVRYVYFFKNMKVEIAQGILGTMLEGDAVQINQDLQACILREKCFNIKAAMKIVKELDTGGLRDSIKIIPLREANARTVKELLDTILGTEREKSLRFVSAEQRKETAYFSKSTKIFAFEAKNSLILLGTEKNLDRIAKFIYKYIDVPIGTAKSRLHIKEIRYAKAETLQPILSDIIKPPRGIEKTGRYKFFEDVVIAAESGEAANGRGSGNRLIIACGEEDWKRLEEIIEKLDKPQPQVAFEVMIVDLTEDQTKELGAQLQSKEGKDLGMGINRLQFRNLHSGAEISKKDTSSDSNGEPKEETSIKNFIEIARDLSENSPTMFTLGRAGISANEGKNANIWAVIRSVFNVTNSHIIAQPYLVANNFQECQINVSNTKRVKGEIRRDSGTNPVRSTEEKDANKKVVLTPQINSDGIVDLTIEVNVDEFIEEANKEPTITRRNIITKATMATGQVLVLGGIKKSKQTVSQWKTPVLSEIPILGNLFKSRTKAKEETILYVFIRPSIIKPRFDGTPDEYTQLKLDYAKYQMMRNDMYVKNANDPIQRWFFRPSSHTVKHRLADHARGVFRPIDDFTYGKRQPKSVDIRRDPYFKVSEALEGQKKMKSRKKLTRLKTRNKPPMGTRMKARARAA